MQHILFSALKIPLLATYALALAATGGWWTGPWSATFQNAALVLLAVHAVELVFTVQHVRRYPGPLALSLVLTLLYGLLHWKPLADQAAPGDNGKPSP